jgi:hypothetical protein
MTIIWIFLKEELMTIQYNFKGISAIEFQEKVLKSELKVSCGLCTEDEHALNRRSEFMIVRK